MVLILKQTNLALQRLKEAAEKAKIELSSAEQTDVNLPFITADKTGPKHINLKMTRAKLEALVEDLIARTLPPCKTALKDAGLTANEIDEIVMVGGMTRMPKVLQKLKTSLVKNQTKVLILMKLLQWVLQFKQVYFKVMLKMFFF